jgi:hypothetical protein
MLFDLSSPGRKNVIRVVYGVLALLFLVGFVGFGIGGELGGGGLIDSITSGGSGGNTADQFEQQIEDAEDKLESEPTDEKALEELAYYRAQSGFAQLEVDESTGQPTGLTEESRTELEAALDAWSRYLETNPQKPDLRTAGQILRAYQFLGDAGGAADVQELLAKDDPTFINYGQLAYLRYLDLDLKRGDEAFEEAEAVAKPSDKSQIKQLEEIRAQVVKEKEKLAKEGDEAAPVDDPLSDPFGGGLGTPTAP